MERIIIQKDGLCRECGRELPKGERCYSDEFEFTLCDDCYQSEVIGETYG